MPYCVEHIWKWFLRMSNRRGGGFGPAALTHTAMHDFFRLAGINPSPWEVEQIEALDSLYLSTLAEDTKNGK
jgi:hypothetical protein